MAEEHDWKLPDLSFMGDPEELRVKAEAALRATPNPANPPSQVHGVDRSGSVQVTVDLDGRVHDIEILDDWHEYLASDELARSLFQAYLIAHRNVMKTHALAALTSERERSPVPRSLPKAKVDAGIPDLSLDEHLLEALRGVNEQVAAVLQRVAALNETDETSERTVSSPAGCFTLQLRSSDVVGVRGNPDRIEVSSQNLLKQEALMAFRKAQT